MQKAMLKKALLLASLGLAPTLGAACGGGSDNLPPPPPPPPPPPEMPQAATGPDTQGETAPEPAPPVQLVLGTAADAPATAPTVKIQAPKSGQILPAAKANEFAVKLDVKNWETAMGDKHVHLILDNRPYKPIYDTSKPIKMSELLGQDKLAEGQHVLVAFPSRKTHESVKTKGALAVVEFFVGKKGDKKLATDKPMLIYSRPKGDYFGAQAAHVLVDFYLANTTLEDGKSNVAIQVKGPGIENELTAKATSFGAPFYLDNLQNGDYELTLTLKDGDGKPIEGAWNSTTRTIKVDRDREPAPMPMPASGADQPAAGAKPAAAPKPTDRVSPKPAPSPPAKGARPAATAPLK